MSSSVVRALNARNLVHYMCILCTLLSLSSCEKAITDDDSVVSGSVADKNANLQVTVFSIEKTPSRPSLVQPPLPPRPAPASTSLSTMKAALVSSRSTSPLPKPISARPPSSSNQAPIS